MSIPLVFRSPPDIEEDTFGTYESFPTPVITIRMGLPPAQQRLTVLHEVLHAIDDIYGLDLGERRVRVLEQALGSALGHLELQ